MLKKKSQKTVKIKSRNVVETDTTSLCLLKKPTYRQHFRGRRSFNYAKRFSVLNQESCQCNPHSNRPLWALRPPFYLASSLHPPHKPSILTFDKLREQPEAINVLSLRRFLAHSSRGRVFKTCRIF